MHKVGPGFTANVSTIAKVSPSLNTPAMPGGRHVLLIQRGETRKMTWQNVLGNNEYGLVWISCLESGAKNTGVANGGRCRRADEEVALMYAGLIPADPHWYGLRPSLV